MTDSPNVSTIALDIAEDMQLREAFADLRRRLDDGRVPESERDEIAELLDTTEVSGLDPDSRAETFAALQRLTATYDRMTQRKAEFHTWRAENEAERAGDEEQEFRAYLDDVARNLDDVASGLDRSPRFRQRIAEIIAEFSALPYGSLTLTEIIAGYKRLAAVAREAYECKAAAIRAAKAERRTAEVARDEAERLSRLDAIRQEAVAAHEQEEREQAERDNAAKEGLRREAERRAAEIAARKRQQLAAWPKRRGTLAESMA